MMSQENDILYRAWGWGEASMEALLRGNIGLSIDLAVSMLLDTCHTATHSRCTLLNEAAGKPIVGLKWYFLKCELC